MPFPYQPALRAAASRGWRVLRGGATAAERRAAALARRSAERAEGRPPLERGSAAESWSAAEPAGQEPRVLDIIDAETGESRRVVRRPAPRYSPEATREQSARAEALRRHAEARGAPTEDPREWGAEGYDPTMREHFRQLSEQEQGPAAEPSRVHFKDSMLLDRFEEVYGWRPPDAGSARAMLSPDALDDLMNPKAP